MGNYGNLVNKVSSNERLGIFWGLSGFDCVERGEVFQGKHFCHL